MNLVLPVESLARVVLVKVKCQRRSIIEWTECIRTFEMHRDVGIADVTLPNGCRYVDTFGSGLTKFLVIGPKYTDATGWNFDPQMGNRATQKSRLFGVGAFRMRPEVHLQ